MGLELQVIFNKGAVMILPGGVNKATGLTCALKELGLSVHNTVGVGDAENDHAFLRVCECAVAVSNALPSLKKEADIVTTQDHGAGVTELIDRILEDDLASARLPLMRHDIVVGTREDGAEVKMPVHGRSIMIAGRSGGGKTTAAVAILERLMQNGYQMCLIDPEGDHEDVVPGLVSLGDSTRPPAFEEIMRVLADPSRSVAMNLIGVAHADRPRVFATILGQLTDLRGRTGRPHWIVVDEAHHVLPSSWDPTTLTLPKRLGESLYVTLHPSRVAPPILATIDTLIAVKAPEVIYELARATKREAPEVPTSDGTLLWRVNEPAAFEVKLSPPEAHHTRHRRKYAHGDLGPDESFYFRGPSGKLNLRAQNLTLFVQIADGVDDETWTYHLSRGDYTRWFKEFIKDPELADVARQIEKETTLSAAESRGKIRAEIEKRYTQPAE
jgi:hypothetical protein